MKILIKNGILIGMSDLFDKVLYGMDILIQDDKIVKIDKNIMCNDVDKLIDASGRVVMPGFVNTHGHVPMSIFRETLDGYGLQDWLSNKIWPMEDKLTSDDIYYASYLSFIEMIKTGTTTINDLYFITEDIIRAMEESGVRMQTSRTLMDNDGMEKGMKRFQELEELINKYNGKNKRLSFNIGIHGLYTNSSEYVLKGTSLARNNNLPIHMHFCENSQEVRDIYNLHGMRPIEVLENKFRDISMILAHCVKLSDEELDILSNMNVSVAHCPISNLKLGCGVANVNRMLEKEINVSLGTDGQGSASNLDMFETMKYTALLQKGLHEDAKVLPAYEVLKMATCNGAKALKMDNLIGSIDVGKQADIIIIDTSDIVMRPTNDLISQIVYNAKGYNVITTIIDGNILMENRKLIHDNEEDIVKHCEDIIKRINK